MNYHWNWGIFLEQVKSGDETYLDWLLTGLGWTLAVSLAAWLIALTIGIAVVHGSIADLGYCAGAACAPCYP